jgi:cyclomaltodextrinase / maltogenic alpha-amylase / neopullulanase
MKIPSVIVPALLGFFIIAACTEQVNKNTADIVCGLASPVNFTGDTLKLVMGDYITDPDIIRKVIWPSGLSVVQSDSSGVYWLAKTQGLTPVSVIQVITDLGSVDLLVKNFSPGKVYIRIPDKNYDNVDVRGNLNYWNARNSDMHKTDSGWVEEFSLAPGEYQYLLVIDGKEQRDPENPDSIDNNAGGFNSLLRVGSYRQEDMPFIRSTKISGKKIEIESDVQLDQLLVFWQNQLIKTKKNSSEISFNLPTSAGKEDRSFIRVIGYSNKGISNDLLIPLSGNKVITNASELNRADRQAMIIYFMMVDRFKNGNPGNDKKVDDPEILPKANYFGGDIAGITQALSEGYFKQLGINTIWLSPIVQNPETAYGLYPEPRTRFSGYHGYWPVSSTKIDYRFGTASELKDLIDLSHRNGNNILLDYVAHHVHELHPVYRQHPEWATPLYLPDGTMNTEKWDEYRLTTWFDTFLPTLELRDPKIVEPMSDSALFWITEYGIDGFRHDATKHIDELFWRTLTRKIKLVTDCDPMPYQIGETYGSPELIASYIGSGMLDAQFDFNVYDNAVAVFARDDQSFLRLQSTLNESLRYYGYHSLMGNITGNQDRPRFISLAGGDLSFTENSKYAGWTREIGVGDLLAYKKLILLHAFNMTIPGIPTIYYGDEFGLPGANDPDNRRWMKFDNLTKDELSVRDMVSKLTMLRRSSMPLLYGDIQFLQITATSWVYVRSYFNQLAFVIFNKSSEPQRIYFQHDMIGDATLTENFGNAFTKEKNSIAVILPGYSFEILTTK